MIIGANPGGSGNFSKYVPGIIDEVSIWNTASTETEIQNNMKQYLTGTEVGLLSCWNFDEGVGQRVDDSSINEYDGYLGTDPDNSDSSDPAWIISDAPID